MRVAAMPGATIDAVIDTLETAHATSPLDIAAVDYLTALGMDSLEDRRHGYIAAMAALRAWAVNSRIPVVVCAQLRRQPPGEVVEPKLSWFQETSALEQKADLALLLWHDKAGPHRRTYARLAKSKYSQLSEPFEIVIQHGVITGTAPTLDEEI
jgi:replicative DNA helicase